MTLPLAEEFERHQREDEDAEDEEQEDGEDLREGVADASEGPAQLAANARRSAAPASSGGGGGVAARPTCRPSVTLTNRSGRSTRDQRRA